MKMNRRKGHENAVRSLIPVVEMLYFMRGLNPIKSTRKYSELIVSEKSAAGLVTEVVTWLDPRARWLLIRADYHDSLGLSWLQPTIGQPACLASICLS